VSALGGSRQSARGSHRCGHLQSHAQPTFSDVLAHYGVWPCLAGSKIPIAKGKWSRASDTPRKRRSKDCASKVWKKRKRISIVGKRTGRYAHPRHDETTSRSDVRRRKTVVAGTAARTLATTSMENASFISMAVWKLKRPITDCHPGDRATRQSAVGALHVRILDPGTNQLLREHLRRNAAGIASKPTTTQRKMPLSIRTAQLLRRAGHAGNQIGYCVWPSISDKGSRHSPHPGNPFPGQEIRYGGSRRCLRCGPGDRGAGYRFVRRYLERRPQLTLRQSIR